MNQAVTNDRFRPPSTTDAKTDCVTTDGGELAGHALPCRVLIFTSPKAGSGGSREQVARLVELLQQSDVDCAVVASPDDLRSQLDGSVHTHSPVVVAAGGDGTVSLAAALTAELCSVEAEASPERTGEFEPWEIPIVPMPLGTENLLARQFGHSAIAESVFDTIRFGESYRLDVGVANDKPFLIMATCGFDAEVVRGMHLTRRGHISRMSYMKPIVRAIRNYPFPRIRVRIDQEETIECRWAMVFNLPRYAANLGIEPEAVGNDGQLDVIAFRRGSILTGIRYVTGIWLRRHLRFSDVVRRRGRSIEISSESRVPYQIDGDYAGRLPLTIRTMPGRIRLLLPRSDRE